MPAKGIHWAGAYAELKELAELLAVPVSTSLEGKRAFEEWHPLSLGSGRAAIPGQLRQFLEAADLILRIGCSFAQTSFGVHLPAGARVIHATLDPADFNSVTECEIALAGGARLTLQALVLAVRDRLGGATQRPSPGPSPGRRRNGSPAGCRF